MTPIQQAIAILEEDALTNRIERALEVLRGVPQSPWMPIETAPKDVRLLLFSPGHKISDDPDEPAVIITSTTRDWDWATHWMPLPAPPDTRRLRQEADEMERLLELARIELPRRTPQESETAND